MRQRRSRESRLNHSTCVSDVYGDWSSERHSRPPACRSFQMNAGEHDKSISGFALHNCCCTVWIFGNNITPARKLRPILPIHIERLASGKRNQDCLFVDSLVLIGKEVESEPRRKVHSVVSRISAEESSGTDSQIMHAILCDCVADGCGSRCAEVLANGDRIPARDDEQRVT